MSVDQVVELTPAEMHAYRAAALDAAARTHAGQSVPEVLHAAGSYLMFMLQGEPIWVIGQTIRETKGEPPAAPAAVTAAARSTPTSPAPVAATATLPELPGEKIHKDEVPVVKAAKKAAKAVAAQVATASVAAPSAPAAASPAATTAEIAPPTTVKEVGVELVKLVQDQSRGGFNAAKALLTEFGVQQLAQIPGAKLAEFMARLKATGNAAPAVADPTGLLG